MGNNQTNLNKEKTLSIVGWISLIASVITILVFIGSTIFKFLDEYVLTAAGVAGILWIATILRKISVAITELREVKNEITKYQNVQIEIKDNKGHIVLSPSQDDQQSIDQSKNKQDFHSSTFDSGGGEQKIGGVD